MGKYDADWLLKERGITPENYCERLYTVQDKEVTEESQTKGLTEILATVQRSIIEHADKKTSPAPTPEVQSYLELASAFVYLALRRGVPLEAVSYFVNEGVSEYLQLLERRESGSGESAEAQINAPYPGTRQ